MSVPAETPVFYCCAYKGKEGCAKRQQCFLFSEYFRISKERQLSAVNGFNDKAPYTIVKKEHSCSHFQSK